MQIKIKPRLKAVASMVPTGEVAADIGTDHAYLPAYLVLHKGCPRVIAVEKSSRNVQVARETVNRFGLEHRVEVRMGNGLGALRVSEQVDTVIFAGLGGKTICQLLTADRDTLFRYRRLVMQPMGESSMLRRWLAAHGYRLVQERLAREKDRYYEIMAAEPGQQEVDDPFLLELGPVLVREKDPLLIPWLEKELQRCEEIIHGLNISNSGDNTGRLRYYKRRCHQLKGVLDHAG